MHFTAKSHPKTLVETSLCIKTTASTCRSSNRTETIYVVHSFRVFLRRNKQVMEHSKKEVRNSSCPNFGLSKLKLLKLLKEGANTICFVLPVCWRLIRNSYLAFPCRENNSSFCSWVQAKTVWVQEEAKSLNQPQKASKNIQDCSCSNRNWTREED